MVEFRFCLELVRKLGFSGKLLSFQHQNFICGQALRSVAGERERSKAICEFGCPTEVPVIQSLSEIFFSRWRFGRLLIRDRPQR